MNILFLVSLVVLSIFIKNLDNGVKLWENGQIILARKGAQAPWKDSLRIHNDLFQLTMIISCLDTNDTTKQYLLGRQAKGSRIALRGR